MMEDDTFDTSSEEPFAKARSKAFQLMWQRTRRMRLLFQKRKYRNGTRPPAICDKDVASPAPATPILSGPMNR